MSGKIKLTFQREKSNKKILQPNVQGTSHEMIPRNTFDLKSFLGSESTLQVALFLYAFTNK